MGEPVHHLLIFLRPKKVGPADAGPGGCNAVTRRVAMSIACLPSLEPAVTLGEIAIREFVVLVSRVLCG